MKIGVFWRKFRNVEFQKRLTPDNVYDDAYAEAHQHYEAIKGAGFDAVLIEWTGKPLELYDVLMEEKVDLIFNVSSLEEAIFLENFGIPYVGSGIDLLATDKSVRKNIVSHYGVPTPNFVIAESPESIPLNNLNYPLFVKPVRGRGSAGIDNENIIEKGEDLPKVVAKITDNIGQGALIEEFIEGREISVGIIGYKDIEILPLLEIGYNTALTNTYEEKMFGKASISCPANLPRSVEENIKTIAEKAYRALNVKDYGRIDFILNKDNIPFFLEINTYAGLTMLDGDEEEKLHHGYMGYMAKAKGYTRAEFIGKIVESGIERYALVKKMDVS